MKVLEITATMACPNKCKHCPQPTTARLYGADEPQDLTPVVWSRVLAHAPRDCKMQFNAAGEPLMNPLCCDYILDAHSRGHPITLFTTLIGASTESILRIIRLPWVRFFVHLPDSDGMSRMAITPTYLAALRAIVAEPPVNLVFVIHGKSVIPELQGIVPRAIRQSMHCWAGNNPFVQASAHRGRTVCIPTDDCYDHVLLLPNGDVYQCCQDFGLKHKIGNLAEAPWDELDLGWKPLCQKCVYARGGGVG